MATLILDIETVGFPWSALDEVTKEQLLRWVTRSARSDEERVVRQGEIIDGLGFSPFTGIIVALGVYDRERGEGVVYYHDAAATDMVTRQADITYKVASEAALLAAFWDGVRSYDTVVTFNGRAFDVPFILHRSVIHGVTPTIDLLRKRYLVQQAPPYHIDLHDELSFYGALTRRPSLHLVCHAYGIDSPKGEVGGDAVATLYQAGRCKEIAEYNAGDLRATLAVYEKWLQYLAPRDFVQSIDF
jgi:DNA polymerase elongation subunit (family B)